MDDIKYKNYTTDKVMNNLSTYIIEKLKIDKDIDVEDKSNISIKEKDKMICILFVFFNDNHCRIDIKNEKVYYFMSVKGNKITYRDDYNDYWSEHSLSFENKLYLNDNGFYECDLYSKDKLDSIYLFLQKNYAISFLKKLYNFNNTKNDILELLNYFDSNNNDVFLKTEFKLHFGDEIITDLINNLKK